MKVRDLLKIVFDNQYIEFNYIDEDGDFTAYDRPIYVYKESENIEELFSFKAGEKIKIINPDSCEFYPGEILKYEPGTIWEIYEDVTNKKHTIKVKDKRSDCGYGTIFISNIERLEDEKEDKKIKSILDYTLSELESIVNIKKKILENEKLIEKYMKQIEEDKKYLEEILCV